MTQQNKDEIVSGSLDELLKALKSAYKSTITLKEWLQPNRIENEVEDQMDKAIRESEG